MDILTLKYLVHRQQEWIQVQGANTPTLNQLLKKLGGIYTQTHKSWLFACTKKEYEKLMAALKGKYQADINQLRTSLKQKKNTDTEWQLTAPAAQLIHTKAITQFSPKLSGNYSLKSFAYVHEVNKHVLHSMQQLLLLKAYSPSTIRTYLNEMSQLLVMLKNIPADELKPEHLKRYLVYCYEKQQLKENTLHSRINAMKFYYEQVLKREKFFWEIPRPKKPFLLPRLLNETELAKLFNALPNKKHKALLFTAYSAGLRVSEIVNLKIADIDSKRMQILIQQAKGKKDRYVNLSPVLLDILRKYIQEYKPRPRVYLFESEQTLAAYPTRTIQQIFSNAKKKAGIRKEVGVHSLRHSFATHLLDKGTDIRYIKDLLGHFNIKTTERYLHVSKKQLVNIISPFDDLWNKEGLKW